MSDQDPSAPSPAEQSAQPPVEAPPRSKFEIGEEFGTAKKNLPPAKIVGIGLVVIVFVAVIVQVIQRPTSQAVGNVDYITAAEIPGQNAVMVAVTVSFQNQGKKPYWVHNVDAELDTGTDHYKDDAASGADFERYFQAFPALKEHALQPLKPELRIDPQGKTEGTVIVSFPVSMEAFNNRKSLTVKVWPYDQPAPLVLTQTK